MTLVDESGQTINRVLNVAKLTDVEMAEYFSGTKLFGDDFGPEEVQVWYDDEKEGYANSEVEEFRSGNILASAEVYAYHALNTSYGFKHLPPRRFETALGIGAARAHEFAPICDRVGTVTVIEPSDQLYSEQINGVPVQYAKPNPDGSLPFADNSFDLITCFGVLHHIATVSRVVAELQRCLRPGGYALVREPTNSMGDWRTQRPGLTKRERGIPIAIFRQLLAESGFQVVAEQPCMFSLINRLALRARRRSVYNSPFAMSVDRVLCRLFSWNRVYHATNNLAKFRPQAVFYVLTKS